jgi:hypothetical protein
VQMQREILSMAMACYQCMLENCTQDDIRLAAVGMCDAAPDNQRLASLMVMSSDQRDSGWLEAIKSCMLACLHERLQGIFQDVRDGGAASSAGSGLLNTEGDYYKGILSNMNVQVKSTLSIGI